MTLPRACLGALLALALCAPPAAAGPISLPVGGAANAPAATAKPGAKLHVWIVSGLSDGGKLWQLQGGKVDVRGAIKPYVKHQTVLLVIRQGGHQLVAWRAKVHRGSHGHGRFSASLPVRASGSSLRVFAEHQETAQQSAGRSKKVEFGSIYPSVGPGSSGEAVHLLQLGLTEQAYSSPFSGYWDDGTARAVLAFRKVNWLSHDTTADRDVFSRLFDHTGVYRLRSGSPDTHVEADLTRQVLVLTQNGQAWRTFTISSGKPSTPTVQGNFSFYRKDPGYNSIGMYYTSYFYGGYAVHGYADVPPNYPASHGCLRVPIPDAPFIYDQISIGEPIYIYST
ncbi:MAG: L,D-transpeptidase [Actinobacteria bacterium]|nr:L,D-transpeptidase [Actinomycetota bacterium]